MRTRHRLVSAVAALLAILLVAPAYGTSLNKSIKIAAGEESNGASTVNGSIRIGEGAVVTGSVSTVNGTIRIDDNARIEDAETVNGSVKVASGVQAKDLISVNGSVTVGSKGTVSGEIAVVNGDIRLESGTSVSLDVSNVNGEISLRSAEVRGDLTTVTGDVLLIDQSTLHGNLVVEKPGGWGRRHERRKPKVVIGPGSRVDGDIVLEQKVELFISESATVGGVSGVMAMGDAVRFSGEKP